MKEQNREKLYFYDKLNVLIHPLSLKFNSIIHEKNFKYKFNADNLALTRIGMILTCLLFIAYSLFDPYAYPSSYHQLWTVRGAVVIFLMASFIFTFFEGYVAHMQGIAFIQALFVGGSLVYFFTFAMENDYKYLFVASYSIFIISIFVVFGFRFINAVISSGLFSVLTFIPIYMKFTPIYAAYFMLLFISVALVSAISAYFLELYKRKFFLKEVYINSLLKEQAGLSMTDDLTQIPNRRHFNYTFERELSRAKRAKESMAFMMVDIDYFKLYNDEYGHLAGDEALKRVAKELQSVLKRPSDFIFRLGGEEFGVIIDEGDAVESAALAEYMCNKIENLGIEHSKSLVSDSLTISIGVHVKNPEDDIEERAFTQKADDALYQAKNQGRNRYCFG